MRCNELETLMNSHCPFFTILFLLKEMKSIGWWVKETEAIAMIYATKISLDQHVMKHHLMTSIYKRRRKSVFLMEINVSIGIVGIMGKVLVSVRNRLVVGLTHANIIVPSLVLSHV